MRLCLIQLPEQFVQFGIFLSQFLVQVIQFALFLSDLPVQFRLFLVQRLLPGILLGLLGLQLVLGVGQRGKSLIQLGVLTFQLLLFSILFLLRRGHSLPFFFQIFQSRVYDFPLFFQVFQPGVRFPQIFLDFPLVVDHLLLFRLEVFPGRVQFFLVDLERRDLRIKFRFFLQDSLQIGFARGAFLQHLSVRTLGIVIVVQHQEVGHLKSDLIRHGFDPGKHAQNGAVRARSRPFYLVHFLFKDGKEMMIVPVCFLDGFKKLFMVSFQVVDCILDLRLFLSELSYFLVFFS